MRYRKSSGGDESCSSSRFDNISLEVECSGCGKSLRGDELFCPKCGKKLFGLRTKSDLWTLARSYEKEQKERRDVEDHVGFGDFFLDEPPPRKKTPETGEDPLKRKTCIFGKCDGEFCEHKVSGFCTFKICCSNPPQYEICEFERRGNLPTYKPCSEVVRKGETNHDF